MLSDYGWQIKTWKLTEAEKKKKWIASNEKTHMIREIFVNNALAVEYKRKIIL